jgi:hypothetical protein
MTLPYQELNSLVEAKDWLVRAVNDDRLLVAERIEARQVLKHYPYPARLAEIWVPIIRVHDEAMGIVSSLPEGIDPLLR